MSNEADARRAAFRRWLGHHGTANAVAKRAGIAVSAIYNFLNGSTSSLSIDVMTKLATATGSSIDEIVTGRKDQASTLPVKFRIGHGGSMFVARPAGLNDDDISAAEVDGPGLSPLPDGWLVFFRSGAEDPERLVGKLATVRYQGGGPRPAVRMIERGSRAGLYTLKAMDGTVTEDVAVMACHEVVSFAAP